MRMKCSGKWITGTFLSEGFNAHHCLPSFLINCQNILMNCQHKDFKSNCFRGGCDCDFCLCTYLPCDNLSECFLVLDG